MPRSTSLLLAAAALVAVVLLVWVYAREQTPAVAGPRPAAWAAPLARPGLKDLYLLSPDLYRGEQPAAEGFPELKTLGVKTVVNLRSLHGDRALLGDTGLGLVEITCEPWKLIEDDEVVAFLRVATDKTRVPVFVHCNLGSDRVGAMCAAYRVVVQGWDKQDAIREMKEGGYGFHRVYAPYAWYIGHLNVQRIKDELLKPGTEK